MHLSSFFAATFFLHSALAFPWLHPDGGDAVKRGFEFIKSDPKLVAEIRELWETQQAELRAWKQAGKRSVADNLLNRTIDSIVGPDNGVLAGLTNSFAGSVEGLKKFPEANYPFKAPGPTDQRGPCPGLNTLANHGYLPRNGIVTAGQVFSAVSQVFNMGADLAAVLIAGAVALNGDIPTLTFSLGGADARTNSLGSLGGILGTETGLDGHGRVNEGDASATRCDFYLCNGDNHNMQPALFKQMQARAAAHGGQYNVAAMQEHFHNRYADSISRNPNFYFIPPSALIVIGATYFIPGFFSNGTIGAGGSANEASIASFEGAHFNADGSITYVPERIPPQGWYRRAIPMTLPEALAGILAVYSSPAPVAFGANAGSTSKFVPGPGLLPTSAQDVDGLGCLLYNALYANFFGEFYNLLAVVEGAVNSIAGLIDPVLSNFIGCTPNIPDQTSSNSYGGWYKITHDMNRMPGAPKHAPCLLGGTLSNQCVRTTNTYGKTGDVVPNKFNFSGVVDASLNPRPQ